MKCYTYFLQILVRKCKNSSKDRLNEEEKHFLKIQTGLKDSMVNIEKSLVNFKNWDELMNLKEEESLEEKLLERTKTIKPELKKKKCWFNLIGLIFCIFHLIGIQEGIIVLNSLFGEIVEELKLMIQKTPRKYNFYQQIEINSYKDLPEIDVGMVTSSIGIIVLKEIGFKKTNSIFQLVSSVLFVLLFLFFKFQINEQLLENYNSTELIVLIISYIILSLLVGCSSTLALKEYFVLLVFIFFSSILNNSKKLYRKAQLIPPNVG